MANMWLPTPKLWSIFDVLHHSYGQYVTSYTIVMDNMLLLVPYVSAARSEGSLPVYYMIKNRYSSILYIPYESSGPSRLHQGHGPSASGSLGSLAMVYTMQLGRSERHELDWNNM